MKLGWKTRVGLVLSAVWLCLVFLVADDYKRIVQVLGLGFLPLVVIWGIVWAVAGWQAQRPAQPITPELAQIERKAKRRLLIRTAIAVVTVLGVGLFVATWQFKNADSQGGDPVAYWFGEWLIWGLVAYVVFRAVPKLPAGAPAVLTALVIVGGINYKAYDRIAEDRQALDSLAKATPLINKIQVGTPVSDQEVRDSRIGMMEPLMLAQATFSREAFAIATAYEKAIAAMQPELMLAPASLASQIIRAQTRANLKLWQQATAEYKFQLEAATARGRVAIQAAQLQMPAAMSGSASKGFDESAARLSAYVNTLIKNQEEASQIVVSMLALMDMNRGGYFVDKGPPANLMFNSEATLTKYQELMGSIIAVSERQDKAQARLAQDQADQTTKLGDLLKR